MIFPWLLFLFVGHCVCDITHLVVSDISGQQEELQGLKVSRWKGADTSRDTEREEEGEYSDSKFGPLIVGVLLIHRDTINSPKSSPWVWRGEDSEAGRCRRKSIDPKTPGSPRGPTSCWPGPYCSPFSRGTAANTHTHTHTHISTPHTRVMHQTPTERKTSLTPGWLFGVWTRWFVLYWPTFSADRTNVQKLKLIVLQLCVLKHDLSPKNTVNMNT